MYKIMYFAFFFFFFFFCIIAIGGSSQSSDPSRRMQRSQSVQHTDPSPSIAPSMYKSSAARKKSLKNMFKGGSIKEIMGRLLSKFFIYESIPPQKADSHHFKDKIFGAQHASLPNCIICFNNDIIILNYDYKFTTTNQLSFSYICRDGHETTISI